MNKKEIETAFIKSIPIMCSYLFVGWSWFWNVPGGALHKRTGDNERAWGRYAWMDIRWFNNTDNRSFENIQIINSKNAWLEIFQNCLLKLLFMLQNSRTLLTFLLKYIGWD